MNGNGKGKIKAETIIYHGIVGYGVGESILELYEEYLEKLQGTYNGKAVLRANGIKFTIEKDSEE